MKWFGLGVFGMAIVAGLFYMSTYNGLVNKDERVKQTYAQVQNVMQRQADLIPNLVETVKGYAGHESATLKAVTEARSALTAVAKLSPDQLAANPELQKQLIEAQANMGRQLISLNAVREAYPELKANRQFLQLMAELTGSQNRITVERRNNQLAVQDYNGTVRRFPGSFIAANHGFTAKPYFEASAEAAAGPPKVKF